MATTLADIAEALAVSKMTVSRAINNDPVVHPDTRARVLAMAQQMNYRPNQHARALATNRSHLLGLVVPDLMHSYFAEIAKAIEVVARAANYEVVICNTEENADSELREVEALRYRTDGLIIASAVPINKSEKYRRFLKEGTKIVLVDRYFKNIRCPAVTTDDVEVGRLATEHLIRQGHRRIGHLRGSDIAVAVNRLEGYVQALTKHRLRVDERLIRRCGFFESDGYAAMQAWMAEGTVPSALFAANDPIAIGAMRALQEAGISVPEKVAVVGAGNIHYGDMLQVPLTTITWDKAGMGQQATKLLLDALDQEKNGAAQSVAPRLIVAPELVVRKSCGGRSA